MLKKKTVRKIAAAIAIILVLSLAGGSLLSAFATAKAASVSELKSRISSLDQQKAEVQKVINSLGGQLDSNMKKLDALKTQMSLTQEDIEATETVIERLTGEIETKEEEIVVAQAELEEKTEVFETRMRVMYENGNEISYLDVVLGASSFGEMLSRMEIVSEVMESDKKVVADFKEAKQKLQDAKAALEQDKTDQETYKDSLEEKYDALKEQKTEVQKIADKLESDKAQATKEYEAIAAEQDKINDEIAEISRREAEAARKAAEEAARKKQQQQSSNSGGNSGSSGGSASYTGSGGLSVWPAPSGIANTSSYGWRTHPVYGVRKFHKGLDISAPGGSPVLAAASGTVVKSYYSSSYGNYIVVSHGNGLMTAYAHMSSRLVSEGARVSAGQQIGKVGSTGISTGNHLHFEVYVNGSTVNPMNYY